MAHMYSCPLKSKWTKRQYCEDYTYKWRVDKKLDCKAYVRDGKCRRDPSPCCKCGSRGGWKLRVYEKPKATKEEKSEQSETDEEIELIIDEDDIEVEVTTKRKKKTEKSESESPMEIDILFSDDDREDCEDCDEEKE